MKRIFIIQLYNGIMNDRSIQRYSMGWKDITDYIEKKFKNIQRDTEIQFENNMVIKAAESASNSLRSRIECFGRELSINLETLGNKQNPSKR